MTTLKNDNSDQSVSMNREIKKDIQIALYDIEVMVENLKIKSTENKQRDIIQRLYDIHGMLSNE